MFTTILTINQDALRKFVVRRYEYGQLVSQREFFTKSEAMDYVRKNGFIASFVDKTHP
jgi:hypothetical protein